jgi:hypothetical protein
METFLVLSTPVSIMAVYKTLIRLFKGKELLKVEGSFKFLI